MREVSRSVSHPSKEGGKQIILLCASNDGEY